MLIPRPISRPPGCVLQLKGTPLDAVQRGRLRRFVPRCLGQAAQAQVLLWLLLSPLLLFGQRYPVVLVPGSPHGIFMMMQDSQSRIWMGTIDDVVCFDGVRFYSLRQYGFPKEIANSFAEDSEGGIWIATQGTDVGGGASAGGLYRYQNGHIEKLFSVDGLSVVSIAADTMLASFGTEAQGRPTYGDLYRFQKSGKTWIRERLLDQHVHHMTVDAQGNTLFPCPGGWCELSRQSVTEWKPGTKLNLQEHAGDPLVERVLRDRAGCVWFRSEPAASYQCPGTPLTTISNARLSYDSSAHIEETSDGQVFMLVSMTLGRPGNFHTTTRHSGLPAGLDTAMVATDGTIWMGTDSGLYRFMYPFQLEYWNQDTGFEGSYSLLKIGDKVFAASTGVQVLSKDRRTWSTLPGTEQLNGVGALTAGPNGTIFAASTEGLTQLQMDGTVLARSGFDDQGTSFGKTKDGQIWFGASLSKRGIRRIVRNGNRLLLPPENVPIETTPDFSYDAGRDTLWACDGKDIIFRRNGTWQRITTKDRLMDYTCATVAALPSGDVWLGYNNSWLTLIKDPLSSHSSVRNYPMQSDQLVANGGNRFLNTDKRGWIWRGSDAVYIATPAAAETGEWFRLGEDEGLPSSAMNQNSFIADDDGSVWFVSNLNVFHFSPSKSFATDFSSPPVFVSGFSVGKDPAVLADTITSIPHGTDVTVHIGSMQFDRRSALRIRYRLMPDQTSWTSQRELDIPAGKLRSGTHTLEVQAQLGSGPWSRISAKSFNVLRPIWLSWPAILAVFVIGGLGAASGYRWRRRRTARAAKNLPALAEWRLAALSPEVWHLAGTVLDGRFEVGEVLARGGFATIAKGKDLHAGSRLCAIKIFRQELIDQEWMTKRFQQEVSALERIHHPNVVRIYGHGTTHAGSQYLVMEYIEGQTLREKLEKGLTVQQTARYLLQIGSALEEIHGHDICHRDLKPENLMIRNSSPDGQDIVLIDFSIAIVKDPDVTLHGLTRAAGTIYYMAPEQSIGYADSSTDIYSLAKIVIEMLTGQRLSALLPDASMDLPERVREFLSGLNMGLSTSAINLISSALQFDPSQRPKNAEEFATQIANDLASASNRA